MRRPASRVLIVNSTVLGTIGSQVLTVINVGRVVTEDVLPVTLLARCMILPRVSLRSRGITSLVFSSFRFLLSPLFTELFF